MRYKKPRGPLGCLFVSIGVFVIFGGLVGAAIFGLTWHHYSTTPKFLEYVRSRPVDIGMLDDRIGVGETLSEERTWQTGELDPWDVSHEDAEHDQVSLTLDVDVEHGDDSLLSLRQRFLFVTNKADWERRGFRIETPQLQTHEDMRALVVVHLGGVDQLVGEGSEGRGHAIVDVFLAAGAGGSTVRILKSDEPEADPLGALGLPSYAETEAGFADLMTHVIGSPPVIGLIHHVRQRVGFTWRKNEDGSQSASMHDTLHRMTTSEYSYTLTVKTEDSTGFSNTRSFTSAETWNDEVW